MWCLVRKLLVEDAFHARKNGSTGQIRVKNSTFNRNYWSCCSDWMCLKRVRAALCTALCCYVPLFLGASRCGCLQPERMRRHDSEHFPLRTLQILLLFLLSVSFRRCSNSPGAFLMSHHFALRQTLSRLSGFLFLGGELRLLVAGGSE